MAKKLKEKMKPIAVVCYACANDWEDYSHSITICYNQSDIDAAISNAKLNCEESCAIIRGNDINIEVIHFDYSASD